MKQLSIRDIAVQGIPQNSVPTRREQNLLQMLLEVIESKLSLALKNNSQSDLAPLTFTPVENRAQSLQSGSGAELALTVFGFNCGVIISSTLALEVVNRYLEKVPPAVDRELNKEEIAVLALVATLIISELRDSGIAGIYLKSANVRATLPAVRSDNIVIEEKRSKQRVIIKLESELNNQLSQRSKLILVGSSIENLTVATLHPTRLYLEAEVKSLSTLFKLKPGILWKLGKQVSPSVELNGDLIGFGNLIVTEKKGCNYEAA